MFPYFYVPNNIIIIIHISLDFQPVLWWPAQTTPLWKQVIHQQILELLPAEINSVIIPHPDDKCTINHQKASAWRHLRKLYNKNHGPNNTIKTYKMEWIVRFGKPVTQAILSICNGLTLKFSVTIKLFQNENDFIAYFEEIYLICLNKQWLKI